MIENHYYPFGLQISGLSFNKTQPKNKYLYNGKELQTGFGLNWYDYGKRFYDVEVPRFTSIDPLAEKYSFQSPYSYAANNPIKFVDYMGLAPTSTHTDRYGNVIAVYDDGDLGVYRHNDSSTKEEIDKKREETKTNSGGGEHMGYTLYINSFVDDKGKPVGKINFTSTEGADWLANFTTVIKGMANNPSIGGFKTRMFYALNAGNGDIYDFKTLGGRTNDIWRGSQISAGIYASARDIGNYAAGLVAKITGQSKFDFMITAGAFNLHANDKIDLILHLRTYKAEAARLAPTYGEDKRSNYFQRLGYEGIKTLKDFNRNYSKIWED